jgi:hypothetical protein
VIVSKRNQLGNAVLWASAIMAAAAAGAPPTFTLLVLPALAAAAWAISAAGRMACKRTDANAG